MYSIFIDIMRSFCLFIIVITGLFHISLAQLPVPGMRIYDASKGFPAYKSYIINQDSTGFIWIGTDQGAVFFDGQQFEIVDEKSGLTDKEILQAIPSQGRKVILSPLLNNWACYKDGHLLPDSLLELKQIKNQKTNMCISDGENLWLGDLINNKRLLYRLNSKGIEKVEITLDQAFTPVQFFGDTLLMQIETGEETQLAYYFFSNGNSKKFTGISKKSEWNIVKLSNDRKRLIVYSQNNQQLDLLELKGNHLTLKYSYKLDKLVKQIVVDKNNQLWLTFIGNGLHFWGNINALDSSSNPLELLPESTINHVFTDRDENIWLSTESRGIYFISASHWKNYLLNSSMNIPLDKIPSSIERIPGIGIFVYYTEKNTFGLLQNGRYADLNPNNLSFNNITDLYLGNEDLYAFTTGKLLHLKYNPDHTVDFKASIIPFVVKDLYKNSSLYIATHNGLYLNRKDKTGQLDILYPDRTTSVSGLDDFIFIGTPNGLYLSVNDSLPKLVNDSILGRSHITALQPIDENHLLIGTSIKGLHLFEKEQKRFCSLLFEEAAITATIRKIEKADHQCFWLATDMGVYKVQHNDFNDLHHKHYDYSEGLPSDDVTDLAIYNDTVYVLTSSGLAILPPKYQGLKNTSEKVFIYKVRAGDDYFYSPGKLELLYRQNDLQLSLKSFPYQLTKSPVYHYFLQGYHKRWYITNTPEINLNNLPPGEYQLQVASDNGKQLSNYTLLPLTIHPVFWQRIWFKVSAAILLLTMLILIIYQILRRSHLKTIRKLENKRKLAQLELEAIKAHINPHFVYNCLNSIQYLTKQGQLDKADLYINSFSVLLRQTMHLSRQTFVDVATEKDYLENYLKMEKMRFKDKLNYIIDIPVKLYQRTIPAMMLQPFVENAIKHGIVPLEKEGYLKITFSETPDFALKITIEDNGPGWDPEQVNNTSSLGLRLGGGRADTYNQLFEMGIRINIENKTTLADDKSGTSVELLIPLKHENYSYNYR